MKPTPSKLQLPTLTLKNNYFIVQEGQGYHYYPIRTHTPENSGIIRLTTKPPLIREGIVIADRVAYHVTVSDLLRGIVRKSSRVTKGRAHDSTTTKSERGDSTSTGTTGTGPSITENPDEPGPLHENLVEITKAADAAWEEQTRSLLQALYQEEGLDWEVADAS